LLAVGLLSRLAVGHAAQLLAVGLLSYIRIKMERVRGSGER